MTSCCSPCLHPQIQASEDGAGLTRLPAAAASLPDSDDLLWEILLRLPPQPSSLPRASAVCKRWRGILTDPKFHRQFYAHHQKAPLLGFFSWSCQDIKFIPILDPPDSLPPQRFDLGPNGNSNSGRHSSMLDCRHGLVLIKHELRKAVAVCDPITGEHYHVAVPPDFDLFHLKGAVLCAATELGHVHGGCHSSPFKVVLLSKCKQDNRQIACVYSSETGLWGNLISREAWCVLLAKPPVLIGNCLYWLSTSEDILEFDLDENTLSGIMGPPDTIDTVHANRQIIQAEDGDLGYAVLSYLRFQISDRNVNAHGVSTWMPWKTIEMHPILGLLSQKEGVWGQLLGVSQHEWHPMSGKLKAKHISVYMVHIKSMQSNKLYKTLRTNALYYSFKSFYTPGDGMAAAVLTESVALHLGGGQCLYFLPCLSIAKFSNIVICSEYLIVGI
ncbi:hypothetical protein QYE76_056871 [Lolium multiflorum]|uniref:F-box domain-containing protein n=1 Tax=Lolium multiflorum TaxID=4521 RepID=A0AAD8T2C9_LOLMU|nr:hypothetical protein QYE76_056871 [Lolium multiflorum]